MFLFGVISSYLSLRNDFTIYLFSQCFTYELFKRIEIKCAVPIYAANIMLRYFLFTFMKFNLRLFLPNICFTFVFQRGTDGPESVKV